MYIKIAPNEISWDFRLVKSTFIFIDSSQISYFMLNSCLLKFQESFASCEFCYIDVLVSVAVQFLFVNNAVYSSISSISMIHLASVLSLNVHAKNCTNYRRCRECKEANSRHWNAVPARDSMKLDSSIKLCACVSLKTEHIQTPHNTHTN